MKIVHFIPSLRRGGSERITIALAKHQQEAGHDVSLVVFSTKNEWEAEASGIQVLHFPDLEVKRRRFRKPFAKNHEAFLKWFWAYRPEAVHSHSVWTDLIRFLLLPAQMSKIQVSHLHLYHPLLFDFSKSDPDRNWLFKKYEASRTQLVAVSPSQYKKALAKWPKSIAQQLHLVPNGVELPEIKRSRTNGDGVPHLLVASSLEDRKNIEAPLGVLAALHAKGILATMSVAGDGSQLETLKGIAEKAKLNTFITWHGAVKNMSKFYASGDFLVFTSANETFGLVPLEAMAIGLPVVAMHNSAPYFTHPDNVWMSENLDITGVVEGVLTLWGDPNRLLKQVENGFQTATKHKIEDTTKDILSLYLKCDTL
jgi:glycosyltransferase involved in cell wall biosynthesis